MALPLEGISAEDARLVAVLATLLFVLCVAIACVWTRNRATLAAIYLRPSEFDMGPPGAASCAAGVGASGAASGAAPADDHPTRVHVGSVGSEIPPPPSPAAVARFASSWAQHASPPRSPASAILAQQMASQPQPPRTPHAQARALSGGVAPFGQSAAGAGITPLRAPLASANSPLRGPLGGAGGGKRGVFAASSERGPAGAPALVGASAEQGLSFARRRRHA